MFKVTCREKSDCAISMSYEFDSIDKVNAFIYRQMDHERGERHLGSPARTIYEIELLD
jgi:hypothetical protein